MDKKTSAKKKKWKNVMNGKQKNWSIPILFKYFINHQIIQKTRVKNYSKILLKVSKYQLHYHFFKKSFQLNFQRIMQIDFYERF